MIICYYIDFFFCHLTKGNNFHNFLFASLDDVALPKYKTGPKGPLTCVTMGGRYKNVQVKGLPFTSKEIKQTDSDALCGLLLPICSEPNVEVLCACKKKAFFVTPMSYLAKAGVTKLI